MDGSDSEFERGSPDSLFEDAPLGNLTLENRVGLSPMTRVSATEDGRATSEMARYYGKFARGGFSYLITEGTYPDEAHSQGYANQPGIANDAHVDAWQAVTEAVHDADTPIFCQLMHAGALVQANRYTDGPPIAPSPVKPKGEQLEQYGGSGEFETPRGMSDEEIDEVIEGFAAAARRAHDAGFDGVEIHAANGYLLDEFLTAYTNERDDEYGGNTRARMRFPREVIDAVIEAVPDEFVVGTRISQLKVNDPEYVWPGGEDDAEAVFGTLAEVDLDYVHVTEGDIIRSAFGTEEGATFSQLADQHLDVPVIANGDLGDPNAAAWAVEEGGADLLTLARDALRTPDWPDRVASGRSLDGYDLGELLGGDASLDDIEIPPPATD